MSYSIQQLLFEISARNQNVFTSKLREKMVYLHIPKCGGVSISKALKSCYVNWNVRDPGIYKFISKDCFKVAQIIAKKPLDLLDPIDIRLRQELLLYGMSNSSVEYISGHCVFSLLAYQAFSHEYGFVTILRDPVERWISEYFYNRFKKFEHAKTSLDIEDYIRTETAQKRGQIYVKILCGLADVEDYSSSDIINLAKENLHKFKLVGCIEHLDDFTDRFSKYYGRDLKIGKWNKNPKSKAYQKEIITDNIKSQIQEICQSDIEIYNYATKNFIADHANLKITS